MSGPDFLFIGASKAGSSWLYSYLAQHPDIYVPSAKDIYYFKDFYSKGRRWYEGFFDAAKSGQRVGEVCHDYLHNPIAIARIANDYPGVKLICILRQPVDRAISTYLYAARHGLVDPDLSSYLKKDTGIFDEGYYADDLDRIYQRFSRDQVLVCLYDDLLEDPRTLAQSVCAFLNVPFHDYAGIDRRVRAASKARFEWVARVGKKIATLMRAIGLHNALGVIKNSNAVQRALYKPITVDRSVYYRDIPVEVIDSYLVNIRRLESVIGRSLDNWLLELEAMKSKT